MTETEWNLSTSPAAMWEHCRDRVTPEQMRYFVEACGVPATADATISFELACRIPAVGSPVASERADIMRDIVPYPNRSTAIADYTKEPAFIVDASDWLQWRNGTIPAMVDDITREPCDKEICCCGSELDGSHDHYTCGPPIPVTSIPRAEPQWDMFPVLAGALESAGCSDAAILEHLRSDKRHWTGCWAIEVLRHGT